MGRNRNALIRFGVVEGESWLRAESEELKVLGGGPAAAFPPAWTRPRITACASLESLPALADCTSLGATRRTGPCSTSANASQRTGSGKPTVVLRRKDWLPRG